MTFFFSVSTFLVCLVRSEIVKTCTSRTLIFYYFANIETSFQLFRLKIGIHILFARFVPKEIRANYARFHISAGSFATKRCRTKCFGTNQNLETLATKMNKNFQT